MTDPFESSIKRLGDMFHGAVEAECVHFAALHGIGSMWRTVAARPIAPVMSEERIYVGDALASTVRIVTEGTTITVTVTREEAFR